MGRLLFYHLPRAGFVGAGALDRSIFFQLGKHALHLSLGEPELFAKRPRGMGRIVFEQRDDLIFQRIYSDICSDIYSDIGGELIECLPNHSKHKFNENRRFALGVRSVYSPIVFLLVFMDQRLDRDPGKNPFPSAKG